MDYNKDYFYQMQQIDTPKLPFYMSYPMQNLYLTELEYEKDMERMKELYPKEVKSVLEYVEDECDRMEYEGSLMFDEYPDRMMMERITDRIYQNVRGDAAAETMSQTEAQEIAEPHLRSLIGVMLNNEMYRRRCRRRRCRRWW